MYNLIVRHPAVNMAQDAYEWYEEQQKGLGDIFLAKLDEALQKLASNPVLYSIAFKSYRQVAIQRFPYVVVYEIDKKDVIIYSIFHTSRQPKKKYRKL